jgi:hypothetical protein
MWISLAPRRRYTSAGGFFIINDRSSDNKGMTKKPVSAEIPLKFKPGRVFKETVKQG